MSGLKEIKNRITSVGSTIQITSAMKMVSAAKLKKAQDAITEMRPYANKMQEILQNVCATLEGDVGGAFIEEREVKKVWEEKTREQVLWFFPFDGSKKSNLFVF